MKKAILPIAMLMFFSYTKSKAEIRLPKLVSDSMILQRDKVVTLWGWASPSEKVSLKFNKKEYKTKTAKDGKWLIKIPAQKAGGPYEMTFKATNTITLKDILFGDVWLCSGQSNMVHQLTLHRDLYEAEINEANYPDIRQFWIPTLTNIQQPKEDFDAASWKTATRGNVPQFSAVAYFFAKKLYQTYHVPIGIINASVGGTPIEAWTSENGFQEFPEITKTIQKNKDTNYINSVNNAVFPQPKQDPDKGLIGNVKWFDVSYQPKGWQNIHIPGYWEDQGVKDLDGTVWYRREIEIPEAMSGKAGKLTMGRIVDADFVYINGVLVGNTTYMYPQRRYAIPAGLLKTGKNLIVIRVINNGGKGGFVPDKPYFLEAGGQKLDLKGDWQYKVGQVAKPFRPAPRISFQNQPTALYNAMIAPLTNYAIKGITWYQGESNVGNAHQYQKLLPALIADWRIQFQSPDLPFAYVQLPKFQEVQYTPSESNMAVLREAQRLSLSVPNTAMAIAIELGEWNDIHPDNKKDVGLRLALAAQKIAYNEKDLVSSGPLFQSAIRKNNAVEISFTDIGSGLTANDGEDIRWFALAGADKKFAWAKATIDGNKIFVTNENVVDPKYVRYAWADNPEGTNLYNKEGLPASPFEAVIQ
jgi:sialate O-acetylesterase